VTWHTGRKAGAYVAMCKNHGLELLGGGMNDNAKTGRD
jgi:hypothetical protein